MSIAIQCLFGNSFVGICFLYTIWHQHWLEEFITGAVCWVWYVHFSQAFLGWCSTFVFFLSFFLKWSFIYSQTSIKAVHLSRLAFFQFLTMDGWNHLWYNSLTNKLIFNQFTLGSLSFEVCLPIGFPTPALICCQIHPEIRIKLGDIIYIID